MGDEVKQPWDDWTAEQKRRADEQIRIADAIKLYRSAGGAGVNAQYAPHSAALERRGGLSPEEATTLARYRMFKQTTGGDPNWQGPTNIPAGARAPAETPETIGARRDAFFKAKPDERAKMMSEDKMAIDRSQEGYFDSLTPKEPLDLEKVFSDSVDADKKRRARSQG